MITIDGLRAYGAAVDEGLSRCMNNEEFYLKLVTKVVNDPAFDSLRTAIEENNLDEAFDAAHRLKGALGNLALTPVFDKVNEMVELLRSKSDADYPALFEEVEAGRKLLSDML